MAITPPTYQLKFALDLPDEQPPAGLTLEDVRIKAEAARHDLEGGALWVGEPPAWFENYLRLAFTGWPWRVACYVAWLAMPKPRTPKTQLELAQKVLGLSSDRQLSVWTAKNPAIPEMVQKLRTGLIFEDLGEIIEAMVTVAKKPDYKSKGDRELIFKLTGMLGDTLEVKLPGGGTDLSKLTWEQKLELAGLNTPEAIEQLRAEARAQQRQSEGVVDGEIVETAPAEQLQLTDGLSDDTGSDAS